MSYGTALKQWNNVKILYEQFLKDIIQINSTVTHLSFKFTNVMYFAIVCPKYGVWKNVSYGTQVCRTGHLQCIQVDYYLGHLCIQLGTWHKCVFQASLVMRSCLCTFTTARMILKLKHYALGSTNPEVPIQTYGMDIRLCRTGRDWWLIREGWI